MSGVINREELLDRVGHDVELLEEVIEIFHDDFPKLLDGVRQSLETGDTEKLIKSAHTLKGSVSNFACRSAYDAVYELEMNGRNGKLELIPDSIKKVETEIESMESQLNQMVNELSE